MSRTTVYDKEGNAKTLYLIDASEAVATGLYSYDKPEKKEAPKKPARKKAVEEDKPSE